MDGILEKEVIGLWSLDKMCSPGAMEDVEIVFTPTGDGWLYYCHPFTHIVDKFNWDIDDRGLMQIKGTTSTACYDVDEDDESELENYFEKASDLFFRDLRVEITLEPTSLGENEVISFSQPFGLTECKFALVHRDITLLEPPSFL